MTPQSVDAQPPSELLHSECEGQNDHRKLQLLRLQDLRLYQAVQRLPLLPFARELLLRLHIPDFLITHSTGD